MKKSTKKYINFLIFIVLGYFLQNNNLNSNTISPIDIDSIKAQIIDEKSDFFYPKLYTKYSQNDTNISNNEYRYLYYGHSLQPYFDPRIIKTNDSVIALRKYLYSKQIDYRRVIELSNFVLRLDPFYLDGIYLLSSSYEKTGDSIKANLFRNKYYNLINTIWTSGDGKTPETAFYVISLSDEYALIEALGLKINEHNSKKINEKMYDVVTIGPNEMGYEQIYFNIELFYDKLINRGKK